MSVSRPARQNAAGARERSVARQRLRLWIRLLRTTRALEAELRERLRVQFSATLPRFDVMAALDRSDEGMSLTRLSRHLMVSNGNVTGLIDRLVAEGHVERIPDLDDRRATIVRLTPAGRAAFADMARAHQRWIDEALSPLPEERLEELIALFEPFVPRETDARPRRAPPRS